MNTSDRIGHPGRPRTDHNRHLLGIGHRGNGHGGRPISFGCRCGSSRRHGVADLVIVDAHYHYFGRIVARPDGIMYS